MAFEILYKFYTPLDSLVMSKQLHQVVEPGVLSKLGLSINGTVVTVESGLTALVRSYEDLSTSIEGSLFKIYSDSGEAIDLSSFSSTTKRYVVFLEFVYSATVGSTANFLVGVCSQTPDQSVADLCTSSNLWRPRVQNGGLIPLFSFQFSNGELLVTSEGVTSYTSSYYITNGISLYNYRWGFALATDTGDDNYSLYLYKGATPIEKIYFPFRVTSSVTLKEVLSQLINPKINSLTPLATASLNGEQNLYIPLTLKLYSQTAPSPDELPSYFLKLHQTYFTSLEELLDGTYINDSYLVGYFHHSKVGELIQFSYHELLGFENCSGAFTGLPFNFSEGSDVSLDGQTYDSASNTQNVSISVKLKNNTVTTPHIADNSITSAKLVASAQYPQALPSNWTIDSSQVDNLNTRVTSPDQIDDNVVTAPKIKIDGAPANPEKGNIWVT